MAWQTELDEIRRRKELNRRISGAETDPKARVKDRLTVLERLEELADAGSFQEVGGMAGRAKYDGETLVDFAPSPIVAGSCTLNGRKVAISAVDPNSRGEVPGTDIGYKAGYAQKIALQWHLPYIRLLDANEGSILEINRAGRTYLADTDTADEALNLLGVVPVISAVMGPVRGLQALDASLCHFSVIVRGAGQVTITEAGRAHAGSDGTGRTEGPPDPAMQACQEGVIDNLAESEEEAFSQIRRFLSYLPSSVWEMPPRVEPADDPQRRDEELLSVVPEDRKRLYDPYDILNHVLDHDSVFEIAPLYGRSTITAFARVNGYPVGVMIKNPISSTVAAMDVAAGSKVIRFMQLCDTFHLPLVYFVDEPGFMVGLEAQREGIVRAGARVVLAGLDTSMPWISFVVRQLYGVAGNLFFRQSAMYKHYAWATANWGGMHIEGGTMAAYRRDIESAPDPEAKREEIERRLRILSSPFRTAEAFEVEDIIDPRETRPLLCDFVEAAQPVLRTQLGPKAGVRYRP